MPYPAQPLPTDLGPLRLDAATAVFLQRQLVQVLRKTLEAKFGPLKSEQLVPTVWDIDPGALKYEYDQVTARGEAEWHSSGAKDFPRANVSRELVEAKLESFFLGYGWELQEIRSAMFAGTDLKEKEAIACRRGIEAFRNKVHIQGSSTVGFYGFINQPGVDVANAVNGDWVATATAEEIAEDIVEPSEDIKWGSSEVWEADTVALPPSVYSRVTNQFRGSSSDLTMADVIKKLVPNIKEIIPLAELETAGVGGTTRMVVYKKDPEVLIAHGSIMLLQHPEQQKSNLGVFVPMEGRIGPVVVDNPTAMKYRDGV